MTKMKCVVKRLNIQKGFTLIELLVVMGISTALFGFIVVSLGRFQNTNTKQTNMNMLISDIKAQQFKAMLGSTEGRTESDDYGIYFYSDRYVLFHGASFIEGHSDNFTVELPENLTIESTNFPNNTIVFASLSGEIIGFTTGLDKITLNAVNINETSVITFNRYGVVIGVN